jgi:hypothetical protein
MSTMRTGVAAAVASVVGYVNRPYFPTYLFQNGEQGWWYDPSDFSTLFQDAAGTTPVTAVEQPCSLMLDKRLGLTLGPELVTNGTFDSDIVGWTATGGAVLAWNPIGAIDVTRVSSATDRASQQITCVAGNIYRASFSVTAGNNTASMRVGTTASGSEVAVQSQLTSGAAETVTFFFTATTTNLFISLGVSANTTRTFDNISVRELPGNHAFTPAAASTARPTVSARVNLLTKTEELANVAWEKGVNVAVTDNTSEVTAPNGTNTASKLLSASTTGSTFVRQLFTIPLVNHTGRIWVRKGNYRYFGLRVVNNDPGADYVVLDMDGNLGNGSIVFVPATENVSYSFTKTGDWFEFIVTNLPNGTLRYLQIGISDTLGIEAPTVPAGSYVYVWHPDFRVANDGVGLPAYQRVNTATDYDTVGFPVYLRADGSNDYMLTNSIDFSAGATNAPLGSDVKNTGVIGFAGTVTLGSYNTTNGQAVLPRVDASNINFVTFSGTANKVFFVDITNTGSSQISLRSGSTVFSTVAAGVTFRGYVATSGGQLLAIWPDVNASTATATVNSVRELLDSSLAPDKVTLCAGVRKLSDAAAGLIVELSTSSTSNNGVFAVFAPAGSPVSDSYAFRSKGTVQRDVVTGLTFSAPITNVLTGIGDISGDSATLRINGSQVASSTADQGTGNYGNYPLYLFSRAGTSLFFNGRFYGSVGRGAQSNDQQIAALEGYMNTKTAAY